MIRNYQINVKGLVQGVWFRKYTREEAIKIGLKGFVRNEPDGNVYIEAEGEEDQLKELLGFLKKGSPLAEVSSVDYKQSTLKNFKTFQINR